MPITVLAPEVSAKIAAGEVVERPASVVKELIENSLDAGASQITVEVAGGGVSLIRVVDNGVGIAGDEAEIAFERYATSKVAAAQDLEAIATLGFRGEALPSIAAVAQVDMLTRTEGEVAGTYLVLKNGVITEKGRRGCPTGTTVTMRNLFRNVPARLKFLKSAHTENSHISNLVSQYSLAFPEVRFTLIIEGRTALRSPGNGNLRDAIVEVYGLETAQEMLEIGTRNEEHETSIPHISGYISPPSLTRSSRSYLSFFVNRRWVQSRMLSYALEEAYQGLVVTGKHPIAVINISLPHQAVDVNVHPAKAEVRFRQEGTIFTAVQKAVRTTLVDSMAAPMLRSQSKAAVMPPSQIAWPDARAGKLFPEPPSLPSERAGPVPELHLPILHVLGQLANTYLIAEGPDGMYLIDQHAAHERVLYEKIRAERSQQAVEVQGLLELLTVELTPRQEQLLKLRAEALSEYGFTIEPFGERTYLVRSVPALLKGQNIAESLIATLDSLEEAMADWEEKIAASLACHGAVKAGQALSIEEMRELVLQLEQATQPYTCPHGRPTMIHLSSSQLEKEFGRR